MKVCTERDAVFVVFIMCICMKGNSIGDSGALSMRKALMHNTSLTELNICCKKNCVHLSKEKGRIREKSNAFLEQPIE